MAEATPLFPLAGRRVWINGHRGMVGSALVRRLEGTDCTVLMVGREALDLRRQADVEAWMAAEKPDAVFLAAATVGGIMDNDARPAEFIYDNLAIETNIIHAAWRSGVAKLLFLSAACAYPREAPQPTPEESLLTGPLDPTNESSAVAKIAGIKMCEAYRRQYGCDFISAQPINLYGPGDNFDLTSSHVVPALLHKAHEAKQKGETTFPVWGSGKALREFLYVDDLADALVFLLGHYSDPMQINIGTGEELSIRELAETIIGAVGLKAELDFDASKPDGAPRKFLDNTRLSEMGWTAKIPLAQGLALTYEWFLEHHTSGQ